MKHIKKSLAIVLALLLLFSLSACGSSGKQSNVSIDDLKTKLEADETAFKVEKVGSGYTFSYNFEETGTAIMVEGSSNAKKAIQDITMKQDKVQVDYLRSLTSAEFIMLAANGMGSLTFNQFRSVGFLLNCMHIVSLFSDEDVSAAAFIDDLLLARTSAVEKNGWRYQILIDNENESATFRAEYFGE